MINLSRITQSDDVRLSQLIPLYQSAFPAEERRDVAQLNKLIETNKNMYLNAIECDGVLAGMFIYWQLENFHYLEHLVVFNELRNKKIGQQVLEWASDTLSGLRLLEVEPADNEMATRRINYYQRNGYTILTKDYTQPSYEVLEDACSLWIMGNEMPAMLTEYIELIKENVYRAPIR